MSSLICFIDKEGFCGTCEKEAIGETEIDCSKCNFKKKFEGKENKEFSFCFWKGELNKKTENKIFSSKISRRKI